jgi:hypothetical protein
MKHQIDAKKWQLIPYEANACMILGPRDSMQLSSFFLGCQQGEDHSVTVNHLDLHSFNALLLWYRDFLVIFANKTLPISCMLENVEMKKAAAQILDSYPDLKYLVQLKLANQSLSKGEKKKKASHDSLPQHNTPASCTEFDMETRQVLMRTDTSVESNVTHDYITPLIAMASVAREQEMHEFSKPSVLQAIGYEQHSIPVQSTAFVRFEPNPSSSAFVRFEPRHNTLEEGVAIAPSVTNAANQSIRVPAKRVLVRQVHVVQGAQNPSVRNVHGDSSTLSDVSAAPNITTTAAPKRPVKRYKQTAKQRLQKKIQDKYTAEEWGDMLSEVRLSVPAGSHARLRSEHDIEDNPPPSVSDKVRHFIAHRRTIRGGSKSQILTEISATRNNHMLLDMPNTQRIRECNLYYDLTNFKHRVTYHFSMRRLVADDSPEALGLKIDYLCKSALNILTRIKNESKSPENAMLRESALYQAMVYVIRKKSDTLATLFDETMKIKRDGGAASTLSL